VEYVERLEANLVVLGEGVNLGRGESIPAYLECAEGMNS
jgi:hypothetical protein